MPTYEYACESCGNRYEKREGFDAPARQKCPKCKKTAQRVLSVPAVVFKGSGFYKTDNRGSSSGTAPETPAATPATPAATGTNGHAHDTPAASPAADTTTTTESAAAS